MADAELLMLMGFAEYAAAHPDDEVVLYCYTAQLDLAFLAFLRIPRANIRRSIAERAGAPFFRHGNVMRVTAQRPFNPATDVVVFDKGAV